MKVLPGEGFAIIDEMLPEQQFVEASRVLSITGHEGSLLIHRYSENWSYDNALAYGTKPFVYKDGKSENLLVSHLAEKFLEIAKFLPDLIGDEWNEVRIHSQIYGRGTKINWHADSHSYGSFAWYWHRQWLPSWGGELLIPHAKPGYNDLTEEKRPPVQSIGSWWSDAFLEDSLFHYSIPPLPNRCVLTAPGVFHSVNRIDPDAGNAMRCSIVGFLVKGHNKVS